MQLTASTMSRKINNFSYFSNKQKINLHRSIYHAEFGKFMRFHKNPSQTYGNFEAPNVPNFTKLEIINEILGRGVCMWF